MSNLSEKGMKSLCSFQGMFQSNAIRSWITRPSQELDGCDELHPAHFSGVTLTQVTLKDAAFLGMERMMIYSAQTVGQGASLLCRTPLKASLEVSGSSAKKKALC